MPSGIAIACLPVPVANKGLEVKTQTKCAVFRVIYACGVVAWVFGIVFVFVRYDPCTGTPEGKAVLDQMVDHFDTFEKHKVWNDEAAVQAVMLKIDRITMWAAQNTTGNERKAWVCWANYYYDQYSYRYKLLRAKNTVKNPFD